MGSFADFKRAKTGRKLGKIETHLAEKLAKAEWGEFRIGDLFEIGTGSLLSSDELSIGNIPRVSAKSENNGIIGYYDTGSLENARHFENFISVNFFGSDGGIFYHPYKASLEMKVHTLKIPNYEFNFNTGKFIAAALNNSLKGFDYGNQLSSSKLKELDLKVQLPTQNGKIDFIFMENFIAELKALRVAELHAYLQVTGLSNYRLTEEEKDAIEQPESLSWKNYSIGSIFDIATGRDVIIGKVSEGSIPLISHQHENNGITRYIKQLKDRRVFDFSTTLSLADRGVFKAHTQNQNFHIGTRVKALTFKNGCQSENIRLFFVSAINRLQILFTEYSQNATDKLPELEISLPYSDENFDVRYMDILISAVKKLVIKDVVDWADREIATTEQVIHKS